jgi:hypothetical protein
LARRKRKSSCDGAVCHGQRHRPTAFAGRGEKSGNGTWRTLPLRREIGAGPAAFSAIVMSDTRSAGHAQDLLCFSFCDDFVFAGRGACGRRQDLRRLRERSDREGAGHPASIAVLTSTIRAGPPSATGMRPGARPPTRKRSSARARGGAARSSCARPAAPMPRSRLRPRPITSAANAGTTGRAGTPRPTGISAGAWRSTRGLPPMKRTGLQPRRPRLRSYRPRWTRKPAGGSS